MNTSYAMQQSFPQVGGEIDPFLLSLDPFRDAITQVLHVFAPFFVVVLTAVGVYLFVRWLGRGAPAPRLRRISGGVSLKKMAEFEHEFQQSPEELSDLEADLADSQLPELFTLIPDQPQNQE